jgi:hypothetical protein
LELIPILGLVLLLLSLSGEGAVGVVEGKGADGRADGKPVGKVGVCSCCANPTIDKRRHPRLAVRTRLVRLPQMKDRSCGVLTYLSCPSIPS